MIQRSSHGDVRNRQLGVDGIPPFSRASFLEEGENRDSFQQVVNFVDLGVRAILRKSSGGEDNNMQHFLQDAAPSLRKLVERNPGKGDEIRASVLALVKAIVTKFNEDNGTEVDAEACSKEFANTLAASAFWISAMPQTDDTVGKLIGQHRNDLPDYLL